MVLGFASAALLLFLLLLLRNDGTTTTTMTVQGFAPRRPPSRTTMTRLQMVRNIDLPECLVFYGLPDSFLSQENVEADLVSLLQECDDTGAAVVVIPDYDNNDKNEEDASSQPPPLPSYSHLPVDIHHFQPLAPAPNPRDLYNALNSITVQPRPFGGSSGFGAKQYADPERVPLAARTVVLCQTEDQTRAARYCGTRVLCFHDNALADAIIDTVDFYLDDIATPGSFWLNPPPGPKDDEGNKVELLDVIEEYNNQQQQQATPTSSVDEIDETSQQQENSDDDDMSDEELQRILADMSSL